MNTSRQKSRSFRLHHINKTSELRKTSQSFMDPDSSFKLAALNSVTKGVKLADLSMMTGRELNKLRVEPLQQKNGVQLSAHDNLRQVRLRYDELKKKNQMTEQHIRDQKEQINKLQIFKKEYERKQGQAKNISDSLKQKLVDIKALLEETETELKVLKSLRWRHNSDKVVYDQRKYDKQQELICKRKQIQIYRKQEKEEIQEQDRTIKIYEKLQAELNEEQRQRQYHVQNLQTMIQEKLTLNNINSQRQFELSEIASRAIQDKMQSQKHWRMVHLTHAFVNKILRNKIESEMNKFKIVEEAFKTIKTATGVSDARTLVTKYLNKEVVYGELLSKIADNQRIINELKAQGDDLAHQTKTLEAQKQVLESTKIKELDLHQNIKELGIQSQKATVSYKLARKLQSWVKRQFKKLSVINNSSQKIDQSFREAMKSYLDQLSSLLQEVSGQDLYKQVGALGNAEKNVRVMPKRSRKNSMGEQIFDVDEEEVNPGANYEEADFINSQHEHMIQANDKFMRHLHQKFQEQRKAKIEKEQSKAKSPVKAPQPKKEEE